MLGNRKIALDLSHIPSQEKKSYTRRGHGTTILEELEADTHRKCRLSHSGTGAYFDFSTGVMRRLTSMGRRARAKSVPAVSMVGDGT